MLAPPSRPAPANSGPARRSLRTSPSVPRILLPRDFALRAPPVKDSVPPQAALVQNPANLAQGNLALPEHVPPAHFLTSPHGRKTTALLAHPRVSHLTQAVKAVRPQQSPTATGPRLPALSVPNRQAVPLALNPQAGPLPASPLPIGQPSTSQPGRSPTAAIARPSSALQRPVARHPLQQKNSLRSSRAACASTPLNRATPTLAALKRAVRAPSASRRPGSAQAGPHSTGHAQTNPHSASPALSPSQGSISLASTSPDLTSPASKDPARQSPALTNPVSSGPALKNPDSIAPLRPVPVQFVPVLPVRVLTRAPELPIARLQGPADPHVPHARAVWRAPSPPAAANREQAAHAQAANHLSPEDLPNHAPAASLNPAPRDLVSRANLAARNAVSARDGYSVLIQRTGACGEHGGISFAVSPPPLSALKFLCQPCSAAPQFVSLQRPSSSAFAADTPTVDGALPAE